MGSGCTATSAATPQTVRHLGVVVQTGETREIVAVQKQVQTQFMHLIRFRERERLAHEASKSLPQRVVPALDVRGLARLFPYGCMLRWRNDHLVGVPKIAKAMCGAIRNWHALPQRAARRFRAVTDDVGDHLPRGTTQGQPYPTLLGFLEHERPHLIEFERQPGRVFLVRCAQRVAQRWERCGLFLSQPLTVLRETPKVRDSPRKLLRSSYARKMVSRSSSV